MPSVLYRKKYYHRLIIVYNLISEYTTHTNVRQVNIEVMNNLNELSYRAALYQHAPGSGSGNIQTVIMSLTG